MSNCYNHPRSWAYRIFILTRIAWCVISRHADKPVRVSPEFSFHKPYKFSWLFWGKIRINYISPAHIKLKYPVCIVSISSIKEACLKQLSCLAQSCLNSQRVFGWLAIYRKRTACRGMRTHIFPDCVIHLIISNLIRLSFSKRQHLCIALLPFPERLHVYADLIKNYLPAFYWSLLFYACITAVRIHGLGIFYMAL